MKKFWTNTFSKLEKTFSGCKLYEFSYLIFTVAPNCVQSVLFWQIPWLIAHEHSRLFINSRNSKSSNPNEVTHNQTRGNISPSRDCVEIHELMKFPAMNLSRVLSGWFLSARRWLLVGHLQSKIQTCFLF